MAMVMFALSLTIYKIFANLIKFQKFNLENYGHSQAEKWDLRHSTRNVRFRISNFFQNLTNWKHTFMQTSKTHTHTHIHTHKHTQRENRAMTVGKICKADMLKMEQHHSTEMFVIIVIITKIYVAHMPDGKINRQIESEVHKNVDLTTV